MTAAEKLAEVAELLAGEKLEGVFMMPGLNILMLSFTGHKDLFVRVAPNGRLVLDTEREWVH